MTAATNLAVTASAGGPKPTVNGPEIGRVCPSVCPNDWDKRKRLAVRDCLAEPYDERLQRERRGQDSNLRTSYPVTGLANPRFRPLSHLSGSYRIILSAVRTTSSLKFYEFPARLQEIFDRRPTSPTPLGRISPCTSQERKN